VREIGDRERVAREGELWSGGKGQARMYIKISKSTVQRRVSLCWMGRLSGRGGKD